MARTRGAPPSLGIASTFPVGLLSFVSKFSVDFGQMMAAGVLFPAARGY